MILQPESQKLTDIVSDTLIKTLHCRVAAFLTYCTKFRHLITPENSIIDRKKFYNLKIFTNYI